MIDDFDHMSNIPNPFPLAAYIRIVKGMTFQKGFEKPYVYLG